MRKKLLIALVLVIFLGSGYLLFIKPDQKQSTKSQAPSGGKSRSTSTTSDISKYTIDNQNSIYYIVNKSRALPADFIPRNLVSIGGEQLRSDTANALNELFDAARGDGINLKVISGYRSYNYQQMVYGDYVKKDGRTKADTYSARPGHSEHQLGLAADLGSGSCDLQICFGDTKAGKWLLNNSYKYGFIIRYGKDQASLTGYQYEPWHVRYVGIDLATKIYKSGKTLEQFFGLSPSTHY